MSSNVYSAVLEPDPLLRRVVLGSGASLGIAGIVLIVTLPFDAAARAAMLIPWCAFTIRELLVLYRAWRNCLAIRITADGGAAVLGADDEWRTAELISGSVLLSRLGWIRLRVAGGPCFGELLRGRRREDRDWRRLQVIWRHFGGPA